MARIFLLSPAKVTGARAGWLLNPAATFPLAREFQENGLPLDQVFTFASGLYFRGKITYARRFAEGVDCIRIITSNAGLLPPQTHLTPHSLRAFGEVDIAGDDPAYLEPLTRDARQLAAGLSDGDDVVLLGSIATQKYRAVLLAVFGDRVLFPRDFIGRGDMSRGALLLRQARAGQELDYITVQGAKFSGQRAPRIADM